MLALPLSVPELAGRFVALRPLGQEHIEELVLAARERSTYDFTIVPEGRAEVEAYVEALLAEQRAGETVALAQISLSDDRCVGVTRFLNLRFEAGEPAPYAVEIGGTWLASRAQGTGINPEAKLLMLGHAFESWEVGRVDLVTDVRNRRSRRAIRALGATEEGVLRSWQPSRAVGEEGRLRDSVIHGIVTSDWPAVRATIEARLAPLL